MLEQAAGIRLTHVPYKGASPSVTALLSGEVEIGFRATTSVPPFLRAADDCEVIGPVPAPPESVRRTRAGSPQHDVERLPETVVGVVL